MALDCFIAANGNEIVARCRAKVTTTCPFEQTARYTTPMLRGMKLQHIKMTVAGLWVLIAVVIAIVTGLSWPGLIGLASVGLLPPLALLLLWNEPTQTISESIQEARR